jgi:hypothetical protein
VAYIVYVDISAKIEDWPKDSVVAVTNGISRTLRVRAYVKQAAAAMLQKATPPQESKPVQFTLMAMFTYLAVKPYLGEVSRIIIDRDYSGEVAHRAIVRQLIKLIRRDYPEFKAAHIRIDNVADTAADILARMAYQNRVAVDGVITLAELQTLIRE